jgi:hypothetical protein
MTENQKPNLKLPQNFPRLYPTHASKSSAQAVGQTTLERKQELGSAQAPKTGTNSWAHSGEQGDLAKEQGDLVKEQVSVPRCALQSIHGRAYNEKPLPSLPKNPLPPYATKSMPRGKYSDQPIPSFPKASASPSLVTKIKSYARIKPTSALGSFGHPQFEIKNRGGNESIKLTAWVPKKDDALLQRHEKNIGSSRAIKEPEIKLFKVRPQYTSGISNRSKVAQASNAYSSIEEKETISNLSSETGPNAASRTNLDHSISSTDLVRQLTNKVDPTSRYLLENQLPTFKLPDRHRDRRGILKDIGRRKQRRASILSKARRVHFEPPIIAPRLSSHFELFENEPAVNDNRGEDEGETALSHPSQSRAEGSEEAITYSESEYSEENDCTTVSVSRPSFGKMY